MGFYFVGAFVIIDLKRTAGPVRPDKKRGNLK